MSKKYGLNDPKVVEKTSALVDNLIQKEANSGVDKYFNNLKDFQKKLGDAMEAIRCIKDLSHGLANPKFKGMLDKLQEQLRDILVETDSERDKLNEKRNAVVEVAKKEEEKEAHQVSPLKLGQ